MVGEKAILRLIPLMQSANLLGSVKPKKGKKFKPVRDATKILVGVPLIRTTATQVEAF